MARTVKLLYRQYLPGGGWTEGGSPKQGKTITWGVIDISSYTTGGEAFTTQDAGLTNIDHIAFSVRSLAGADVTTGQTASAEWHPSSADVEVYSDASTELASGAAVVTFQACGDSARDVESLA